MATAKFKDASPYAKAKPSPPTEDYLYQKFCTDLSLKRKSHDNTRVNVALFGVGRAGTIHLASITSSPRAKLLYIVDDVQTNWEDMRKYWYLDGVTFLNSKQADRVYNDPQVHAVVVASPTYTHEDIVKKALHAKKAVFCEKPIAENRINVARCYEAAKSSGMPLFCAFNRRFDPSFISARERVRKGDAGHIQIMKTVSRDSPLPSIEYLKISSGIFHDCMVHDIDTMTWILGEYPIKVAVQAHAHIPEIKQINDFDTIVATLHFPSGTLGMIDLSRNSCYGYDIRVEAFGPKGMISANNEQPIHCVSTQLGLQGLTAPPIWYSFPSRFLNAYRKEFDHFIDVVLGNTEPCVQAKEILAVSKIASACEESARTGKMVEIKWDSSELLAKQ